MQNPLTCRRCVRYTLGCRGKESRDHDSDIQAGGEEAKTDAFEGTRVKEGPHLVRFRPLLPLVTPAFASRVVMAMKAITRVARQNPICGCKRWNAIM